MTGGIFKGAHPGQAEDAAGAELPVGAPDAMAAAAALDAAKSDPTLAHAATAYFLEQARLVELQRVRLKQRLLSDRLRIGLQIFIAALAGLVAVGVVMLLIDAASATGLVVEGFSAPPGLAEHGITGDVLAQDLAGRLTAITRFANANSITHSVEARLDDGKSVRLAIPATGLSLEDASHFLEKRLGHERRITADLREFGAAGSERIVMTLRMTGADPIVLEGALGDLDHVMQDAAEHAFAEVEPTNIVLYLLGKGRPAEALAAAGKGAVSKNPPKVRADFYALWGNVDVDMSRSLKRAEISLGLDPSVMVGWWQASIASGRLGHDEAALTYAKRQVLTRPQDQPENLREGYPAVMAYGHRAIDLYRADFRSLAGDLSSLADDEAERLLGEADVATKQHDRAMAGQKIALAEIAGTLGQKGLLRQHWSMAAEKGDWSAAKSLSEELIALHRQTPPDRRLRSDTQSDLELMTIYQPQLALAEAMSGNIDHAKKLIEPTPLDCYLCVRMRARITAASGDQTEADRWFTEAVRQAPSIPYAETEWGEALLARGDFDQAASKFRAAHAKGPHFADPLKGLGDALARQGHRREAVAAYDEALALTPAWAELRNARNEAK